MKPFGRTLAGLFFATIALALAGGCASSLQPVQGAPIANAAQIAGKWAGTMSPGSLGGEEPFYITIGADGTYNAWWGANTGFGKITVKNSRAKFEMDPGEREGPLRLYDAGGKRTLVLEDTWSSFRAQVTPQ
jgi:hypothetical protein